MPPPPAAFSFSSPSHAFAPPPSSPLWALVHLRPLFLLLLQLVVSDHFLAQRMPPVNFRDAQSIVRSEGEWTRRMDDQFVQKNVLPFIRQFRRQLKPPRNLQWVPGGDNLLAFGPNQSRKRAKWGDEDDTKFTHIDLDPAEQRKYRKNRSVSSLFDLGGLIVRELWKKAKGHCIRCEGGRRCELVDPQCGFPYQLFDERVEQIYCVLTLQKKKRENAAKNVPLKAKMKCATFPPTPSLPNALLATDYQKNWKLMCVNCTFPNQSNGDTDYDSNAYGRGNGQMDGQTEMMMMTYGGMGYGNEFERNYNGREWGDGREWEDGREGEGWKRDRGSETWRDGERVPQGGDYEDGRATYYGNANAMNKNRQKRGGGNAF